ncbi:zinc finger protein 37-like [Ruditapes philippinarum]|uniref:zinc finger protein 37-like n=1 Tax=Ruditapes philippinarum TaxID=129788 RepID=UPI00295C1A1B|nr:zinc finger protein 37-like [Ruditapes philippinarum]
MDSRQISSAQEEEFTCTQCMDCFEDRDALFKHVKLVHQQHVQSRRKFRCDHCQKTFKSMSGLRNHSRTHSDYFALSAEVLNAGIDDTVSFYNTGRTRTVDDCNLTTDSDSMQENYNGGNSVFKLDDIVSRNADNVEHSVVNSAFNSDKIVDNVIVAICKRRRRSSIPVPIGRSLIPDRKSKELLPKLNGNLGEESTKNSDKTNSSEHLNVGQESRINIHALNENNIHKASRDVQQTVTISSPFGKKYAPKTANLVTPKSRSRSRSRTPRNKTRTPSNATRTPNSRTRTPNNRMRTPHSGTRTPNSRIRTPNGGTRTPNSGKRTHQNRNDYISNAYNCKKCGKSFVDKSKLDVHFAVHIRETPEKCGISKNLLKKTPTHKMTEFQRADHLLDNNATFSCKLCARTYDKKCYLDAHMKTHDAEIPFSCTYCDKKFRFLSSLKAHSFVHLEESKFHDFHLKALTSKYQSTVGATPALTDDSMQRSTGLNIFTILPRNGDENINSLVNIDFPFSCKMCDFKTRAPSELLFHIKSHSNSGSYKCAHCFKAYRLQKNLKTHEKVHTINRLKHLLMDNSNKTTGTSRTILQI